MKTSRYHNLQQTEAGRAFLRDWNRKRYEAKRGPLPGPVVREPRPAPIPRVVKPKPAPIVAIDGEGATLQDGRHVYTHLGASTGEQITAHAGLSTEACLQFLLGLRAPGRKLVAFGFDYDANMILSDLPENKLRELAENGFVYWNGPSDRRYCINAFRGKTFSVSEQITTVTAPAGNKPAEFRTRPGRSVTVYDCFGWFHTSFIDALDAWRIGSPEDRRRIRAMKDRRSSFDAGHSRPVAMYNALECKLLVEMVNAVLSCMTDLGISVDRLDGAGAIAASIMDAYGMREFLPESVDNDDLAEASAMAYYGGRSQALQCGAFTGGVHHHDINSAYPSAIAEMPSWRGTWRRVKEYNPDNPWALWRVSWNVGTEKTNPFWPLTPFPWRNSDGSIAYPQRGEGWYWAPLVTAARELWGSKIKITPGYEFTPDVDGRPWNWVEGLYERRRQFRAAGDARASVIKSGVNAMYGKLAQSVGFRGKRPPFACQHAAGWITATTHAKLLRAGAAQPRQIIAFAVDSIWTKSPLAVPIGTGLGEWRHTQVSELWLTACNLYAHREPGQDWQLHASGWRAGEYPLAEMMDGWRESGWMHSQTVKVRRFLGLQNAIVQGKLAQWRQWIEITRTATNCPGNGFPGPGAPDGSNLYWHSMDVPRGLPTPYKRWSGAGAASVRETEDQP